MSGRARRPEEGRAESPPRVLVLNVDGVAKGQGSMRAPKAGVVVHDNPSMVQWRSFVGLAAMNARLDESRRNRFFVEEGPVWLTLTFRLVRPKSLPRRVGLPAKRPDLDKLVRAIGDALKGVLYRDDGQVVSIDASKRFCLEGEAPGVLIEVQGW